MKPTVLYEIVLLVALVLFGNAQWTNPLRRRDSRPNILVILTDDQDLRLSSLDHMEQVQGQLVQKGTTFTRHYGHVSQCCPARATLWTGKHAHNTNVTSVLNKLPGGAWKQIQAKGWYKHYLPVWLKQAGYQTYYSGKIFNGYNVDNYCKPVCLEGWDKADLLTDPYMYHYYDSSYVHFNGSDWKKQGRIPGYSTDQITDYVADWIDHAVEKQAPFFAVAAPVAPHMAKHQKYANNDTRLPSFAKPKNEYVDLYPDLKIPRTANFNPSNRSGVNHIWDMEQLDEGNVWALDEQYRYRQRALKSVDDMVEALLQRLDDTGVLDNTVIIYTSDNGYHLGNHRLQGGKLQCFEEDVNIPLIIRGPLVGINQTSDLVTGHIDIAPTILGIAGVNPDPAWKLDGTAISFPLEDEQDYIRNLNSRGESTHIEFWGPMKQEGMFGGVKDKKVFHENLQIYKALRAHGSGYNLMYSVWCQNEAHELYDMTWDEHQMTNLHPQAPAENFFNNVYHQGMNTLLGRPTWQVVYRLDALVLVQKSCSADTCREPWKQLHPEGNVNTLAEALQEKFDAYYENSYKVAKVGWEMCYNGLQDGNSSTLYSLENEQPFWQNIQVKHAVLRGAGSRASFSAREKMLLALALLVSMAGFML